MRSACGAISSTFASDPKQSSKRSGWQALRPVLMLLRIRRHRPGGFVVEQRIAGFKLRPAVT